MYWSRLWGWAVWDQYLCHFLWLEPVIILRIEEEIFSILLVKSVYHTLSGRAHYKKRTFTARLASWSPTATAPARRTRSSNTRATLMQSLQKTNNILSIQMAQKKRKALEESMHYITRFHHNQSSFPPSMALLKRSLQGLITFTRTKRILLANGPVDTEFLVFLRDPKTTGT